MKRISKVLEYFHLDSKAELDHVLDCSFCDPFEDGGSYFCLVFRKEFRGWVEPLPREPSDLISQTAMDIWATETLFQSLPVLRFGQCDRDAK